MKTEFTSIHGTVIVYTRRHIGGCKLRDSNENHCSCPKWLYSKPKTGKAAQRSAGTPSFTEASEQAQKILRGFDPEIRAAREVNQPKAGITIEAALALYKASEERRDLAKMYLDKRLAVIRRRNPKEYKREKNTPLLDFLDRSNATARVPIVRVEQISSDVLDEWAATWQSNDLTSHLWRGYVRMFLGWCRLHGHLVGEPDFREPRRVKPGNRSGFFSEDQLQRLRASLPFYKQKGQHAMPENFIVRMGCFVDLARHGGMALADIVRFCPTRHLTAENVLTYARVKNGQVATVALDAKVAARLRVIPSEAGSDSALPFRFPGIAESSNRERWRVRLRSVCKFAGITYVETETGKRRPVHPHAMRDAFAIAAIVNGVDLENVARMLGHSNTLQVQRAYLPWVRQRIDHCVEQQRAALVRQQAKAEVKAEPEPEAAPVVNFKRPQRFNGRTGPTVRRCFAGGRTRAQRGAGETFSARARGGMSGVKLKSAGHSPSHGTKPPPQVLTMAETRVAGAWLATVVSSKQKPALGARSPVPRLSAHAGTVPRPRPRKTKATRSIRKKQ
jgi:integrase